MKRKTYPKEFKEQIICEVGEIGNLTQVAKRHEIAPSTVHNWLQNTNHKAWELTPDNAKKIATYIPSPKEFKQLENENSKLKEILGDKDLEIAILRDLVKKVNPGYLKRLK